MREFFRRLNIFDNLDVIIAFIGGVAAIGAIVIDQFGGSIWTQTEIDEIIRNLTVIILTALAIGMIRDRSVWRTLLRKVEYFAPEYRDLEIRHRFREEIKEVLNSAKKEIICQMRSGSVLNQLYDDFNDALGRGCTIKIIICDQSPEIVQVLAQSSYRNHGITGIKRKQDVARQAIEELKRNSGQKLKIKEVKYHPSTLKYIADPKTIDGVAFIVPITFQGNSRKAPSIKLSRRDKKEEFDHYYEEFEQYWKFATTIQDEPND